MSLLDVDEARGTCDVFCEHCQHVHRGLRIAPGPQHSTTGVCGPSCFTPDGDPHPAHGDLLIVDGALLTRPCPMCGSVQAFFRAHLPHDAGETPQPGSLVGTIFPEIGPAGSIVLEHRVGGSATPFRMRQCSLIRAIQRHPDMAPHAPLHEAVLLGHILGKLGDKIAAAHAAAAVSTEPAA